jgi:AraC-like DNA-binding protein
VNPPLQKPNVPPTAWLTYWNEARIFPPHAGPVAIRRPLQSETSLHGHAFTELVIVTDGTGMHTVDDLRYSLSPGDIFVITGHRRHSYCDPEQLRIINVMIRRDFMETHRAELLQIAGGRRLFGETFYRPRCLPPEELDDCLRLVERLEQELAGLQEGSRIMQEALLLELLVTVSRRAEGPAKIADLERAHIGRALSFIERHYAEDIKLEHMAKAAHMSPRSFQRHFKAAMGMSSLQYLQRHRIANCCRLLGESNASIQSIAADCGLPEPGYFCRLFRRMTGTTPSAFRRHHIH